MKKLIIIITFILFGMQAFPQVGLIGDWKGIIRTPDRNIGIILHFTQTDDNVEGDLDIPEQSVKGFDLSNIRQEKDSVFFEFKAEGAHLIFKGTLADDSIDGDFQQGPYNTTFSVKKFVPEVKDKKALFPQREVEFHNGDTKLAGTLSFPKAEGKFTAVILVSGSGQQTREENIFGFEVFTTLANYLNEKGIAVLRYDDRGVGESTGDMSVGNTFDNAADASAGIDFLKTQKEIDPNKIGIIGHSEGGVIATILASKRKDLAFIVMMAGTALRGDEILMSQTRLISEASNIPEQEIEKSEKQNRLIYDALLNDKSWEEIKELLTSELNDEDSLTSTELKIYEKAFTSDWMRTFIKYNPVSDFDKIECPVLALFGGKDLQVDAKLNSEAMVKKFKELNKSNYTIKIFEDANHLFQKAETGLPQNYGKLEKQFCDGFLEEIEVWIKEQVK